MHRQVIDNHVDHLLTIIKIKKNTKTSKLFSSINLMTIFYTDTEGQTSIPIVTNRDKGISLAKYNCLVV